MKIQQVCIYCRLPIVPISVFKAQVYTNLGWVHRDNQAIECRPALIIRQSLRSPTARKAAEARWCPR